MMQRANRWWLASILMLTPITVASCSGNKSSDGPTHACSDGIDNDGDGQTDFPDDLGCVSPDDETEDSPTAPQCSDGRDNDGDGKVDYPDDPGCSLPQQDDERDDCPDGPGCPACANGKDDDGNGRIDYPSDPGCTSAGDPTELLENPVACGSGLTIKALPANHTDTWMFDVNASKSMLTSACGGGGGAPAVAYILSLVEPKVVVVSTNDPQTTADTVIDIRKANCGQPDASLACNDDMDSSTQSSQLTKSLAAGTYYVIVEGHDSTVTGTCGIKIDLFNGEHASCTAQTDCGPGLVCRAPNTGGGPKQCQQPMCSDGFDNDGDGVTDYPAEPGCSGPDDNDEMDDCPNGPNCPECSNGRDDDHDGKIDYPNDTSCHAAGDSSEACQTSEAVTTVTGATTSGDTTGATNDYNPSCASSGNSGPDRLYRLDLPAMATLNVDLNGVSFDSVTALLGSTCGGSEIKCSDATSMQVTGLAAGTYYAVVDGYHPDEDGTFALAISGTIAPKGSCEGELYQAGVITCAAGFTCGGMPGSRTCRTQCSDGVDNNGDGKIDYPNDPGCSSLADDTEATVCPGANCPQCADGVDNDGDGKIDYPADSSCLAAGGTSESCISTEAIPAITAQTTNGTTVGATNDTNPTCASSSGSGPDRVYQLDVPTMQTLHVDLTTSYDTVHYLLGASCNGAPLACSDPTTMTVNGLAAGRYYVGVDGYFSTSSGTYTMNVYGTIAPNGRCDGALAQAGAFTCGNGLICQGPTGNKRCSSQCSDGIDNNGDGRIDYPDDPGCSSPSDNTESSVCPGANCPVCADAMDNDGDTAKDYPTDFGCSSAGGTSEVFCAGEPDFGGRIQLPTTNGTLAGAAASYQQSCQSNTGADMAFSLALPVPVASLTIDTEGSAISDTILSLKDANCGMELGCDDDSGSNFLSSLTVANVPKGNYAIQVDGFGSSNAGAFKLNVHGVVAPQTACTNALFTNGVLACPSGTTCTGGKCQ